MGQLHVVFFPFVAYGHMIPIADMAIVFAARGVKTTIITTPLNAPAFAKAVERTKNLGNQIDLQIIKFPAVEAGLPEGCENSDQNTSLKMLPNFFKATTMLQGPLEHVLHELRPNCLVADMFYPWATEVAAKFNIPRIVFHGTSFFALCASESMRLYKPFKNVSSDSEPFILPCLPHKVKLTRRQVPPFELEELQRFTMFADLLNQSMDSDTASFGVIVNSFYELEPEYARHYREVLKRKAWHVGPVSLCNREVEDKIHRGKKAAIDEHECLNWLDSKIPNSVIYVSFGSLAYVANSQLYEIAMGLEASGQEFIWVVRKGENEEEHAEWLLEEFEERMKGKGLIIKGWAPQVLILDHEAIGGFFTHCGWNSITEGVCGGVPMVTRPVMGDQFYNEKLVTDVLRIGVSAGVQQWSATASCEGIKKEEIEKAVKRIMIGEEAEEMRSRAKVLKEMAKIAIEQGGSSFSDLNALMEELAVYGS